MVNFGERIAYWYLRLQGFLQAEDYVLHQGGEIDRTADTDLLGVRLRHSREEIDGKVLMSHKHFAEALSFETKHVVVIAQVKTGISSRPGRAFEASRMKYALRFVGAFDEETMNVVVDGLKIKPVVHMDDNWVVAKVLFAESADSSDVVPVSLDGALAFIEERLASHHGRKSPDRLSFPDELMQFLAWRSAKSPS